MRLFFSAVRLSGAVSVIAQTQAASPPNPAAATNLPTPNATVVSQALVPGQRIKRAAPAGTPAHRQPIEIPPDAPEVTLEGVCTNSQPKSASKTVIPREDLDRFVNAFAPNVSASVRGRLAVPYAGTLAFSAPAEPQGFDKNPVLTKELDDQLKLVRTRILASAFLQTLPEQTNKILEPEVQRYYAKHHEEFEQAQVRRLSAPFAAPTEDGHPLDHTAVKSEMELLRNQAVAGDDFDQLQRDAYKHLPIQASPPANAWMVRRSDLQGEEAKTFDQSPGEVSTVLTCPGPTRL